MPYYLSSALVAATRGRHPFGSDVRAGSNWILYDADQSILWTPDPIGITDARLTEIGLDGDERSTGATRAAFARLLGDGRGMSNQATLRELIVNAMRTPPVDGRQLRPLRAGKTGAPGFKVWLGPGVATAQPFAYEFVAPSHSTKTYADTFDRANANLTGSTSSDGLFTWLEVDGAAWEGNTNAARIAGLVGFDTARANADLDTDDHYAQATIVTFTNLGPSLAAGVLCRWTAGTNGYGFEVGNVGAGAFRRIYRFDNDANVASDTTATTSGTIRLEVDGSSLTAKLDGSTVLGPTTNTQFTGQLRTGISGFSNTAGNLLVLDNFGAGDLTTGVTIPPGVGALVVTGLAPAVMIPLTVLPALGSLPITGRVLVVSTFDLNAVTNDALLVFRKA